MKQYKIKGNFMIVGTHGNWSICFADTGETTCNTTFRTLKAAKAAHTYAIAKSDAGSDFYISMVQCYAGF